MKNILKYIAVIFVLASCSNLEKTIELDLEQAEKVVVIDGLITDELRQQRIVVGQNVDFYTTGATPKLSGAFVTVSDDEGNTYTFEEDSENQGVYLSEFQGIIGRTYSLKVEVNGGVYEATETLNRVAPIDSLGWEVDWDEVENEADLDSADVYDVLIYTKEPQDTKDYYLFKFYENGVIKNDEGRDIFYADDEYIGENIDGLTGGYYHKKGDSVTVEFYSMARSGFLFYQDMELNLNNDGGLFGPIPANLRNNISNGALGLFQVSAVSRKSIIIGEE
ncbi:DUF4249 domain-containing protein [Flexithrix dorotheae]|uniref:DUF4249 domain-containing protein n=1 Tax=Flexithrix dorotheae TaxID=70993 RepID=UPI0003659C9E|nr:DUF4249 domain-containing protein [Flexithrix dorotheae]